MLQVYAAEYVSKIKSIIFYTVYGTVFKHTHLSCNDRENIYAHLSYGDN